MIADPATVVLTALVAHWADDHPACAVWLIECLQRHNTGDWGELGPADCAANDHAIRHGSRQVMSRYPVPDELSDPSDTDDAIWIITDDLDFEPITTILWPSDY